MTGIVAWGSLITLLLILLNIFLFMMWRQLNRRIQELTQAQLRASSTDIPTSMLVTGLARVEARLQQLASAPQAVPEPPPKSDDRAYQLAQRLARNGASASEIANACGLTQHEAELLWRLHAPSQ